MGSGAGPEGGPTETVRELRRNYHDRIAELREQSQSVLECAVVGVGAAAEGIVEQDLSAGDGLRSRAPEMTALVSSVDNEVVSLLALESPVARDLRLILAARDVAQIGLLCVGLCRTVASRVGAAGVVLTPALKDLVGEVGAVTASLLSRVATAWRVLDAEMAVEVIAAAEDARLLEMRFFAALLELTDVPMEAALDLGMSARAFERLTDHAVEIADRVLFAVGGVSPLHGA